MPTLIDSFLVEVGLDPSGYEKGARDVSSAFDKTKESARTSARDMEDYGKKSAAFFGKLKTEALGLFLAFAGASTIKGFLSDILDGDASAGRLAKNLGVATQSVSAYRMVVESLGGSAGDADATLNLLAQSRESLRLTGTTGHDAELMRLGVTKADLEDPMKALDAIAKTGEKMKREDYFALLNRLGIPPGAIESLNKGKAGLDGMIAAKIKDGAATQEDADKAQAFHAKLVDLENHITGALRPGLYVLITQLDAIVQGFEAGTLQMSSMTPILLGIGVAFAAAGGPVTAFAALLALIAVNLDKIKAAWHNLGTATDFLFDPLRRALGLKTGAERDAERAAADATPTAPAAPVDTGTATGAPIGEHVANRRAYITSYLQKKGWSTAQARGIVAAMGAENDTLDFSRRNPISAGKHHAFGLGQWVSADRRNAFKAKYGHDIEKSNAQEQLEFFDWELRRGNGKGVKEATTAHAAMEATVRGFYRPGSGTAGDLQRGARNLGEKVTIGTINVNAPNANPQAVADKVPAAINDRLGLSQANRNAFG